MSLTPEFIFQTVIVRGLQRMRSDYKLVAQLFRNLDQKSIAQISDFIKTNPIDLSINYPRSELKVPAIVILLKAEDEFQAFLGDSMGVEIPDYLGYDGVTDVTQLTGAASVSSSSGNAVRVFGPHFAFTGTRNTLRVSDPLWHTDQWIVGTQQVRIIAGTGAGQVREILGNSRDTLMTTTDWLTIPDSTSQFAIVQPASELVGEPSTLYDRVNTPDFIERRGGLYTLTYTMQVIGPNPEATIYLTSVLKGILTLYRKFLEEQGVINFKMATTDFTPRSEYVPDFAYVRGINVEFVYPFDVFEPLEEVARSFRLVIEGQPPDNSVSVEPVLSDTSWTISPPATVATGGPPLINPLSDVQRVYFGAATPPMVVDATFVQNVLGTEGTAIASKRQMVINFATGPGQYMYYSMPSRFNTVSFNFVDFQTNLPVGFSRVAQINITTTFGTEVYDVWKSDNANLGLVQVSVT
jgi:hypothetical protein